MGIEFRIWLDAGTSSGLRAQSYVVYQGVRHVAIDVLPREPVTFRVICGKDLTADELPAEGLTECKLCRRFEWPSRVLVDITGTGRSRGD
jgi:hypothetical protein